MRQLAKALNKLEVASLELVFAMPHQSHSVLHHPVSSTRGFYKLDRGFDTAATNIVPVFTTSSVSTPTYHALAHAFARAPAALQEDVPWALV
jgi:hypothetical protein